MQTGSDFYGYRVRQVIHKMKTNPLQQAICYCPSCGEQNCARIGDLSVGIKCVKCDVGFIPDNYTPVPSAEELAEQDRLMEQMRSKNAKRDSSASLNAIACFGYGIFICVFIGCIIAALDARSNDGSFPVTGCYVALGFLLLGMGFHVLELLTDIRTELRRRS